VNPGLIIAIIKKLLEALGSEAETCRTDLPAPYQTTQNMDNMDAPSHSKEYLAESARSLQEAFQQGFTMGIKMARFNMTKSMENYKITLDRAAMAAKWDTNLKFAWVCKGSAACGELLKEADEASEKAREQGAAKMRLKTIEDGKDKLFNLADTVYKEAEDKTQEEFIELGEEVLYNKGNILNIAQMLLTADDPDILVLVRVHLALDKGNKAANNSCVWITGLHKRLEFLPRDSETTKLNPR
jgi:hypothetical protein